MAATDDFGQLPSLQKLQSAEQMELLDVVDSLRACGLSEIVALPQLIVCGDQSSGKSSVLEAISGIPFPKQETLCTRFATEVILRRATRVEINVSIVPSEDRDTGDHNRLLRFRRELKSKDDLERLFKIAGDEMGLPSSGKSFSNDILRVEFCGPSQPQLTLVDLPGLIHSETSLQTAGDVQLVHNLVSRYLENPRSIILAVVSAKNDIGNQIILRNARKVDPQGQRTLGIITKPDLLAKGSKSEEAFINLARNEDVKFSLGWHVVKNIDSSTNQDPQDDTRDQQESLFFQESGFNRLPAHTIGIAFLRARLSKVLFSQIRRELPRLVEDIQTQINSARIARDKLGPSRSKPEQQREFLISLSQTFQSICRDAVKGDYDHEFFQGDASPERRLCAKVMNMHFDFASDIRKNGAYWLVDNENVSDEKHRSREEAIQEACMLLKKSRGRELPGLPNPLLVGELFRQYSRPWGDLARLHIKQVWETATRFLELLLRHLTDEDVCENIFAFWLYPIMEEKLNLAYAKHDELLEVHKDHPMTTNTHFVDRSRITRKDPSKKDLASKLLARLQKDVKHVDDLSIDDIDQMLSTISTKADLDMDMVAAEEAFENMNAYYEVALNLFTDNVPTLAIQAPIIREVPKIFCPTAVYSMDTALVNRIAGETEEKITERDSILRRLATLEKGAVICKQYAKRPQRILNHPSDQLDMSELSISDSKTPGNEGRNTPVNSLSTQKTSTEPAPKTASTPGLFSHLSVPSQTATGSRSEAPSTSAPQQNRTPSPFPKPEIKKSTPSGPSFFDIKPMGSAAINPEPSRGLFGTTPGPSVGNPFANSSPAPTSGENSDKKPTSGGIFGSTPIVASGGGLFAGAVAKPVSGGSGGSGATSSTTPTVNSFGNPKPANSLFGSALASNNGFGSTLAASTSNTSTGSFGGFSFGAAAKNDNSLNFPVNTDMNMTNLPSSTLWNDYEPFCELDPTFRYLATEPSIQETMINCFQHISSMPVYIKSHLRDYKLVEVVYGEDNDDKPTFRPNIHQNFGALLRQASDDNLGLDGKG